MPSKYASCQVRLELLRKHFQIAIFDAHNNAAIMAQVISNSGHDDMIHDAVLDYYGRRLATCSSDKTIKIFEIEGDQHRLSETLKGYPAPPPHPQPNKQTY
jgi:WD40 repeat protein